MRDAAIMSGRESSITAHAYTVIMTPAAASVMPKPEAISVKRPMGMNSEVLSMNAESVRPASAIHCRDVTSASSPVRPVSFAPIPPPRAPHIHTPLRIDPQKRLAPHDTGPAEQPIDYRGPTVDPRT